MGSNAASSKLSINTLSYALVGDADEKTIEALNAPNGFFQANIPGLEPGKQYVFKVSSVSIDDATKTDMYSGKFTTKGYPVLVTVTENKKPATNAKVTIGDFSYRSDKKGRIEMEFPAGSYEAVIATEHGTKTVKLAVAPMAISPDGVSPTVQTFSANINAPASETHSSASATVIGAVIGLLCLIVLIPIVVLVYGRDRYPILQEGVP